MSDEHHRHPSYGLVQFSRCQVSSGPGRGMRLFGSALADHHTLMRLQIRPAKLQHDLQQDRVFTDGTMPLIEIDMSAAQFAELITTANYGSGVPCTIRYANGERVDEPPDLDTEAERIRGNFKDTLAEYVAKADRYRKDIEALTEKLPAKTKQQIKVALDVITHQLSDNVPFVVDQFNAATDRITSAAKAEVESFTLHAVTSAGIAALSEQRQHQLGGLHAETDKNPQQRQLGAPTAETDVANERESKGQP